MFTGGETVYETNDARAAAEVGNSDQPVGIGIERREYLQLT